MRQQPRDPPASLARGESLPVSYRAVVLPSGELLPIEARLGRRVLRTIDPRGDEGLALLADRRVELIGADESMSARRVPATDH